MTGSTEKKGGFGAFAQREHDRETARDAAIATTAADKAAGMPTSPGTAPTMPPVATHGTPATTPDAPT
jgi:hypothetical protein